jgi:hypothetical protein
LFLLDDAVAEIARGRRPRPAAVDGLADERHGELPQLGRVLARPAPHPALPLHRLFPELIDRHAHLLVGGGIVLGMVSYDKTGRGEINSNGRPRLFL